MFVGFIPLETNEVHVYDLPPRITEDLMPVLQAAGTTVNEKVLRRVQYAQDNTAVCLEMDEGRFKHLLQLIDTLCFLITG
jgi:hypothetical protein